MAWCNIFQIAPLVDWLYDTGAGQKFAADLSAAAGAPAIYIGYSDTSDAAMSVRYEPGKKPKKTGGKESDNDWLVDLAKKGTIHGRRLPSAGRGRQAHRHRLFQLLRRGLRRHCL